VKKIYFVSNHPSDLSFYYNLAKLLLNCNKEIRLILVEIDHPYRNKQNTSFYKTDIYYKIYNLPNVDYEKNVFNGIKKMRIFNRISKAFFENEVDSIYSEYIAILPDSAWFPVNKLIKMMFQKGFKIFRFQNATIGNNIEFDFLRTLLTKIYTILGSSYSVKSIRYGKLKGADFAYTNVKVPGKIIRIVPPSLFNKDSDEVMPFPLHKKMSIEGEVIEKNIVIFFGDYLFYEWYKDVLPNKIQYLSITRTLFEQIRILYPDCLLYYKPHPLDNGQVMEGVLESGFEVIYDQSLNAEMILDKYFNQVQAVYSIFSTSSLTACMRGINAYVLYQLFIIDNNIKKKFLDTISNYNLVNIKSIDELKLLKRTSIDKKEDCSTELIWEYALGL
jgi:hypothetical protein